MTSLTDLCSVCFQNQPKYTCPRCGCHTCGLQCVKTHKRRAKCSGVRDPAAYTKSNELATAASIDQDYNFITKVQRDIEKAEQDVTDRGITIVPASHGKNAYSNKSKLEIEYGACGVTVIAAPKGLRRSKQNRTHWDRKHNCIMWTVEWVLQDGTRVVGNVQGGRTVLDAFTNAVGKKRLPQKRKREEDPQDQPSQLSEHQPRRAAITHADTTSKSSSELEGNLQEDPAQVSDDKTAENVSRNQEDEGVPSTRSVVPTPRSVDDVSSRIHFYLHRPKTSSKWTCLIPVSSSTRISDILRDRTVLEFPTIHARHEAQDQLHPPLITEKDYEDQYGRDVVPKVPVFGQEPHTTAIEAIPDHIDEKRVLEVLQKDLGG